jgi:hypothetical protein
MGFMKNLLTGSGGDLINGITGLVGQFRASPEEKLTFDLELKKLVAARDSLLTQEIMAETQAKARVMTAELRQGDTYTKRLRPTLGYLGIVAAFVQGASASSGYPVVFPLEFWVAWGGMMTVYSIGRTAEKRGAASKAVAAITGSRFLD